MKKALLISLVLTGSAIGLGIFLVYRPNSNLQSSVSPQLKASTVQYRDTNTGFEVKYPKSANRQSISASDSKSGVVFRLGYDQPPAYLVTIRLEKGLKTASQQTKQSPRDLALTGARRVQAGRFPNYQEISQRSFTHHGKLAAEIIFVYRGPSGEEVKQRLFIIQRDDDSALYLASQAKTADFDSLNQRYFEPMIDSFRIVTG